MTHAGLQKAVTDLADWLGIWHWHDNDSRKNKAGLPDLLLIGGPSNYDGPREMWRELKVPPDDLRPAQRELGDRMIAAGIDWAVWRPEDWQSGRIRHELEAIR